MCMGLQENKMAVWAEMSERLSDNQQLPKFEWEIHEYLERCHGFLGINEELNLLMQLL